jgi:hypothetical protein
MQCRDFWPALIAISLLTVLPARGAAQEVTVELSEPGQPPTRMRVRLGRGSLTSRRPFRRLSNVPLAAMAGTLPRSFSRRTG